MTRFDAIHNSDLLTFTLVKPDGKTATVKTSANALRAGELPALKEVIGWALADPETNADSLAFLDDFIPALYDLVKAQYDERKDSRLNSEAELNRWKTLSLWYAEQRGITLTESSPAPASYSLTKANLSAAKALAKRMAEFGLFEKNRPLLLDSPKRLFFTDGAACLFYRGVPQELMEFDPVAPGTFMDADTEFPVKAESYFTRGNSPADADRYAASLDYVEIDAAFDYKRYANLVRKTAGYSKAAFCYGVDTYLTVTDADERGKLDPGDFYNADLLADYIGAIPGPFRAFMKRDPDPETGAHPVIIIGENVYGFVFNVRKNCTIIQPMKSHQMLTACRVKSARAPKPKTEKKPTPAPAPEQKPDPQPKPKAEKKPVPAPQETKPAPVKEISPAPVPAPVPPASPAPSPLSPAEISAAAVKSSIPSANVEIKGAKTSCPIVWAYDVPKQDEEKIKSLGFLWANKRQGWWKKPGAADAQATA